VAERRRKAEREVAKLRRKGHPVAPVVITGRGIAASFWGKAWCDNLESYHDYENRLPRGRSYVRNGLVVDLQIAPRKVTAMVSGSSLYRVTIGIGEVAKAEWQAICKDCMGGIESLVELLQGRLSKGVMERICRQDVGLFPRPSDIRFSCSCLDHASMCKHVAAVLYGVGARLDQQPELLFRLRAVNENDLIAHIDEALPVSKAGPIAAKVLDTDDLSAMFGLDMAVMTGAPAVAQVAKAPRAGPRAKVAAARKAPAKRKAGKKGASGRKAQAKAKVLAKRQPVDHPQPRAALRRSRLAAGQTSREL
jgi:uncharacterized Zn finger protein